MKRTETPWGQSQHEREHAPGIVFYSTSSHGGYGLSSERYADFCKIPQFQQWSPWLEEDCDACLVYLRWPELATNEQIHGAVLTARTVASWAKNGRWERIVEWLDQVDQPQQQTILIRAQQHANDVKQLWERGSMSTTDKHGIWSVWFRRGEETRTVNMDYPTKRYYTDDELNKFSPTIESHNKPLLEAMLARGCEWKSGKDYEGFSLEGKYEPDPIGFIRGPHLRDNGSYQYSVKGANGWLIRYFPGTEEGSIWALETANSTLKEQSGERYRTHTCLSCKHQWASPVVLSEHSPAISGERTEQCPSCNSRGIFSSPIHAPKGWESIEA